MTRTPHRLCHRGVMSGILAWYLLMLFVVPLVHDEVACARSATHCVTCAASGMAAASVNRVSSVSDVYLAASGPVRGYGHLVADTLLPFQKTGRSPPDLHLEA